MWSIFPFEFGTYNQRTKLKKQIKKWGERGLIGELERDKKDYIKITEVNERKNKNSHTKATPENTKDKNRDPQTEDAHSPPQTTARNYFYIAGG